MEHSLNVMEEISVIILFIADWGKYFHQIILLSSFAPLWFSLFAFFRMVKNLKANKTLWLLIAGLSLIAASIGVLNQNIYIKVLESDLLPGTVAQDVITIMASLLLLFLSARINETDVKKQIVVMSLLAYLFYGYGIYVIERVYNPLYILYMMIVGLSFWSIVFGLVRINQEVVKQVKAPKMIRYLSAGCLFFTAILFYFLWIAQLLPLMRTGEKIEFFYSIFILDMVFVLPAIILSGVFLLRKNSLGLIFSPILFFKAFTLLFSVGLGGLLKPLYGQTANQGETAFYVILSIVYLAFAVLNCWKISFQDQGQKR